MTAPAPVIRGYGPGDRARVREICWRTGLLGDPVAAQWRDRESFAEIFSGWYTDRSPENATVVEIDGAVEGYLLGCVDSRQAPPPERVAASVTLRRALPVRPGTAATIWRSGLDSALDRVRERRIPGAGVDHHELFARWPAHLHLDLLPAARGLGAGTALLDRWLDRLRDLEVPGCHLSTMRENERAVAFFASRGFRPHGSTGLLPGLRSAAGGRLHGLVMVHDLR